MGSVKDGLETCNPGGSDCSVVTVVRNPGGDTRVVISEEGMDAEVGEAALFYGVVGGRDSREHCGQLDWLFAVKHNRISKAGREMQGTWGGFEPVYKGRCRQCIHSI